MKGKPMDPGEIEASFLRAFIVPGKRDRYLEAFSNPKKRQRVLDRLNHHPDDLDPRYRVPLPQGCHSASDVEQLLVSRGAPSQCYVMSSSSELDRRDMPLHDALERVVGYQMATLISCVPGRVGFYESEDMAGRYLLERKTG
jgi:hypothetical protein